MNTVVTPQSRCRFAIRRVDITPPVGIYHRMWGAARHDQAEGIHRSLYATAAVFARDESNDRQANDRQTNDLGTNDLQVIVALDHCVLPGDEIKRLKRAVAAEAGIPAECVLVVFSHTHAAGLMSLDRSHLPGGEMIPPYLEEMNGRVARIVTEACGAIEPATVVYGTGSCRLAAHRDFQDEERQQIVCGFNPQQEADETVLVARVDDRRGRCLATVVNYACHPTTLAWENRLISPDYPGAMREVVEQATDGGTCLFLQGASGDLGPVESYVGDVAIADRNGRQLGYAALEALSALPPCGTEFAYAGPVVSGATLGTWQHQPLNETRLDQQQLWRVDRETLPLAYRPDLPTREQTQESLEEWSRKEDVSRQDNDPSQAAHCRAMAERERRLLARLSMLPESSYPLQVFVSRWGDAIWVAVQGEPYNQFQQALRTAFPDQPVVVMALANEWGASYLVPEHSYGRGIYQEQVAVLAAGCLEKLTSQVKHTISRLLEQRN